MTDHTPEQAAILSLLDQLQDLRAHLRDLTGTVDAQAMRIRHLEAATLALADHANERAAEPWRLKSYGPVGKAVRVTQ